MVPLGDGVEPRAAVGLFQVGVAEGGGGFGGGVGCEAEDGGHFGGILLSLDFEVWLWCVV